MAKDTKERILMTALELFSQHGYEGTNIRELTASLGLVKSAMYRHFESKEEIWDALLDQMVAYYEIHLRKHMIRRPRRLFCAGTCRQALSRFRVQAIRIILRKTIVSLTSN